MFDLATLLYAVEQLGWAVYGKWAFLLVLAVILTAAIIIQNKQLGYIASERDSKLLNYVLQTAKARGYVVCGLWCMFCGFIIFRDVEKEILLLFSSPSHNNHNAAITPAPPEPFTQVTPEDNQPKPSKDKRLNQLKASYEDAFVSYMLLERCEKFDSEDYNTLYTSLADILNAEGEPLSAAHNILIAASGSYQALYHDTPCEESYIQPVQASFSFFLDNISKN